MITTYVTLPTKQQIWGDEKGNGQLQVMKDYGTMVGMSDLAILLGGCVSKDYKTIDGQRTGPVWSASSDEDGDVRAVDSDGDRYGDNPDERDLGVRPILPSSFTSIIERSEARLARKISGVDDAQIDVMHYGEYPQTIASGDAVEELKKKQHKTGKKYKIGKQSFDEYMHDGRRYIEVIANPYDANSVLSDGSKPEKDKAYWVEVQPIEWLKDPTGVYVSRQALVAGIPFDSKNHYDGVFENTRMHESLNWDFLRDIQVSRAAEKDNAQATTATERLGRDPLETFVGIADARSTTSPWLG